MALIYFAIYSSMKILDYNTFLTPLGAMRSNSMNGASIFPTKHYCNEKKSDAFEQKKKHADVL
jgi:hypothetical protein